MAGFTVYVTRALRNGYRRTLEALGSVIQWDEDSPAPRDELLREMPRIDALLCMGDDRIDGEIIRAGGRLRVISTIAADVDHIDVAEAARHGIVVCHTSGIADTAMADMTLTLLLACARSVVEAHTFIKDRGWQYRSPNLFLGADVQGSTIGILGLNGVGLEVAHRALGFGMRVLYYDPQRHEDAEHRLGVAYGSLENVLREADFITLHLPLSPETRSLLDAHRLRLMKPTAYLINMAHGNLIDHDALVTALRDGWIAGAGLDVFNREPVDPDDPLLDLPNVVLSPHIGANTRQTLVRMTRLAVEQLADVLHGRHPAHAVPDTWTHRRAA